MATTPKILDVFDLFCGHKNVHLGVNGNLGAMPFPSLMAALLCIASLGLRFGRSLWPSRRSWMPSNSGFTENSIYCLFCQYSNLFPCDSVLHLCLQFMYLFVAPLLYIIRPFFARSSSCCFPFHVSEHHLAQSFTSLLSSILQM